MCTHPYWEGLDRDSSTILPTVLNCDTHTPPFKTLAWIASFPGLHAQLLLLAVQKVGGRPGRIYHVMYDAADITFSLLTSGLVLSLSLFFP